MEKIKYLRYSCKVKMDQEASQPTGRKKQGRSRRERFAFLKWTFNYKLL